MIKILFFKAANVVKSVSLQLNNLNEGKFKDVETINSYLSLMGSLSLSMRVTLESYGSRSGPSSRTKRVTVHKNELMLKEYKNHSG